MDTRGGDGPLALSPLPSRTRPIQIRCNRRPLAIRLVQANPPCNAQSVGNLFKAAARSRHPGGVNVVMCDSSVRFVADEVDLATWRAASTTQGEEVYSGL